MSRNSIKLLIITLTGLLIIFIFTGYLLLYSNDTDSQRELITDPFPIGGYLEENGATTTEPINDFDDNQGDWDDEYYQPERDFELENEFNRLTFITTDIIDIKKNNQETIVKYLIPGTGNIQEIIINNNRASEKTLYAGIFPNVYNSQSFSDIDNQHLILQYTADFLNRKNTYLKLNKQDIQFSEENDIDERIVDFRISPNGQNILYTKLENNILKVAISDWNFFSEQIIFDSSITNWTIEWLSDELIAVFTKPSFYQDGYLYFINLNTSFQEKIMGPKRGLNIKPSPDGLYLLLSYYKSNELITAIYDSKEKKSQVLGIKTFSDKCSWSDMSTDKLYCAVIKPSVLKNQLILDDWYMGSKLTKDELWEANIASGEERQLFEFPDDINMDIKKLKIIDNTLFFINKYNSSAYMLNINDSEEEVE